MKQLADGLSQLSGFPPHAFNIYVAGDVLIDAGTRYARRRILRQVGGTQVKGHALTHAHADHQGSSKAVCDELGIPFWCPAHDADAAESGDLASRSPDNAAARFAVRYWAGPGRPVDRRLREGDEVGGFTVLDAPGHSPGQVVYWRESDRALIAGDVLNNINLYTGLPGLHEPPEIFTVDPARNRESARRIAALEPALVVFGHGPPLRDPEKLQRFVAGLPA